MLGRQKPLSVTKGIQHAAHDVEGRVITAEFESMYVVSVYVPNSGDGLKRLDYRTQQWDSAFAGWPCSLTSDVATHAADIVDGWKASVKTPVVSCVQMFLTG